MKKLLTVLVLAAVVAGCSKAKVYTDGLRFCEGVTFYGDTLLVSNFGTDELDPLNTEGKGYIMALTDTVSRVFIPADGNLSGPKGMEIVGGRLYIADVGKVVVYDLSDREAAPQVVMFPEADIYVNDLAADDSVLYVSVTNTGNIYKLGLKDASSLDSADLSLFVNVPGANGVVVRDGTLYVASYPADGMMSTDNVVYSVSLGGAPVREKLTMVVGQYDGLAFSAEGDRLYVTSWADPKVNYYDFATGKVVPVDTKVDFQGPARMVFRDGALWIPDLPASRVVKYKL